MDVTESAVVFTHEKPKSLEKSASKESNRELMREPSSSSTKSERSSSRRQKDEDTTTPRSSSRRKEEENSTPRSSRRKDEKTISPKSRDRKSKSEKEEEKSEKKERKHSSRDLAGSTVKVETPRLIDVLDILGEPEPPKKIGKEEIMEFESTTKSKKSKEIKPVAEPVKSVKKEVLKISIFCLYNSKRSLKRKEATCSTLTQKQRFQSTKHPRHAFRSHTRLHPKKVDFIKSHN
jgi:hypothetical protein